MRFRINDSFRIIMLVLVLCSAQLIILSANTGQPVAVHDNSNKTAAIVETYQYPRISPRAEGFKFKANNKEVFVYQSTAGPFAAFSCSGTVNIEVEVPRGTQNISISPKRLGIEPLLEGSVISFQLPGPTLLAVMAEGLPLLYIYANPLEHNKPDPSDPKVKYFKGGQIYEVDQLVLKDDETLYIEGGAVVRGSVFSSSSNNVRVAGYGVLDGSFYENYERRRSILFENVRQSVIEDIIMIEPTSWMITLGLCEDVTVRNVKQLGYVSTSDGVDIVGSRRIRVLDSFLRNGDDCVAIKSFDFRRYDKHATMDYSSDVEDIEVRGNILIAYKGGHAFEIGHELTTDSVSNIRFVDNDVLGVHDMGGVFGINNSDRVIVSNILYEDIRVEHYYNKLINLRVIKSRFSTDEQRGQIRDVTFRNIDVTVSRYNPGYSVSFIGGYDENHTVERVTFDNFILGGTKVTNADQLDLFTKQVKDIIFK